MYVDTLLIYQYHINLLFWPRGPGSPGCPSSCPSPSDKATASLLDEIHHRREANEASTKGRRDLGTLGTFMTHDGSMYAIYGNIYHQYTPVMLAYIHIYIYQHHGSVMGDGLVGG